MAKFKKPVVLILLILLAAGAYFLITKYIQSHSDENTLTLYGNVDIRQVDLGFRVFGRVNTLYLEEGDPVEPGQLVAELDPQQYIDDLARAQKQLLVAESELENAKLVYERRIGLVAKGSISQEELDDALYKRDSLEATVAENRANIKRLELNIADTHLHSLSKGSILSRVREPGSVVNAGEPIFVISIDSPLWVRAYVTEPNLGKISPGMKARIYTDTKTNPIYNGHIGFISPVAEFTPKNVETTDLRTELVYRLRVVVNDPDKGLRQGMPVTVVLDLSGDQ